MRKVIFIFLLIVVHNTQLFSAASDSTEEWDFSYDLDKTIKTEKLHANIDIQFHCSYYENGASVFYNERRRVTGSKEPNAVDVWLIETMEITKERANKFKSNLEQSGFNELLDKSQKTSQKNDLFWHEYLTFNSKQISFESPPEEGIRFDVNEAIFSFINELELNKPDEPNNLYLGFIGDINLYLSLELSEPLRLDPVYYSGKIIKSMEVYEEQGIKKAIITIVDSNEQVIDIWNATIPDSNDEYTRYEGREAYEGKTIEYIDSKTEITITEGDFEPSRKVTLQEIFENPDKFHGKRVCVKGFYNLQFEDHRFYDRQGNRVWIDQWSSFTKKKWEYGPTPNILEGILLGKQRGYATVEGIFLKGPGGHFGMSPGEIKRITRFDAHLKVDYIIWLILLVITTIIVLIIRKRRKRMRYQTIANQNQNNEPV